MPARKRNYIMFVDTNILLDFYRERKSDVSLKFLNELENVSDRLILGSQLEMEYKKNRQLVILESLGKFGVPDWGKLSTPAIISEMQAVEQIARAKETISKQHKLLSDKIKKILENPIAQDKVYQVLQRIFKMDSELNLNRTSEVRFEIRELAKERFLLGYPPRKNADTSIGDAINWEWLIRCAKVKNADVVIVSRDGDYGVNYKEKWYINDWLAQEFKQRVNVKAQVILTGRLSEGLKLLKANVTKEMEEAESRIIEVSIEERMVVSDRSEII